MNSQTSKTLTTQNILLSLLIVINVMLVFLVIYFFLADDKPSESVDRTNTSALNIDKPTAPSPVVAYSVEAAKRLSKSGNNDYKNQLKINDRAVAANKKDATNEANQQVKISESLATINKSLDDIGALSSKDASYVEALAELRKEVNTRIKISQTTATAQIKQAKAKQANAGKEVDYFNKVDVGKHNLQLAIASNKLRLTNQIADIVAEPENTDLNQTSAVEKTDDQYLKTLKTESIERSNQMRTIEVVKGDSLWDIAERAYGDGFQYPRIFAANPNITDPDKIEIGVLLRVPF